MRQAGRIRLTMSEEAITRYLARQERKEREGPEENYIDPLPIYRNGQPVMTARQLQEPNLHKYI